MVLPRTTDDIVKLFRYCRETGRHATFRAAGTSLNGQSLSDDILIDVRRHWYGAKVEDAGRRVGHALGRSSATSTHCCSRTAGGWDRIPPARVPARSEA